MTNFLLDLLFPKRCVGCKKIGSFLCSNCFSTISFNTINICSVCNRNSIDSATHSYCRTRYTLDGLSSGVVYKGVVRKLIYQFKYKPYLSSLSQAIDNLLYEALIQNEVFYRMFDKNFIVTSVPLHKNREQKRGYNHASLIGRGMAKKFSLEFTDTILIRTRDTKPQFKLDKKKRAENIKGAFSINYRFIKSLKGKQIFLVDDLATTCTTLNECTRILKQNGAKAVWGVTFAREI